jgi:hypothetical protein
MRKEEVFLEIIAACTGNEGGKNGTSIGDGQPDEYAFKNLKI